MHSMIRLKLSGKLTKKSNQHSLKVFMLISGEQVLTKSEQNIPVKQKWPGQNIQTDLSEDSRRPPRRFESVQRNLQAASSSQRHILDISSSIRKSDKKVDKQSSTMQDHTRSPRFGFIAMCWCVCFYIFDFQVLSALSWTHLSLWKTSVNHCARCLYNSRFFS